MFNRHRINLVCAALVLAVGFGVGSNVHAVTTTFTGGDVGEGLDFSGSYLYAINPNGPTATVQGLTFINHAVPQAAGVTITSNSGSPDSAVNGTATFGASANDVGLNTLMKDLLFRFAPNNLQVNFAVTPGKIYEVQLLMSSLSFGGRTQDVIINGVTLADNLSLPLNTSTGTLISHTFTAGGALANVTLGPSGTVGGNAVAGDNNAILNGFAVREIFDRPNRAADGAVIAGSSSFNNVAFNVVGGSGDFTALNVIDGSSSDVFASNYWLGSQGGLNEFFVLDLGKKIDVEEIHLKNTHNSQFNDSGTQNFRIFGAPTIDGLNNLVNGQLLVEGVLSDTSGQGAILADIFNSSNGLIERSVRYLRFEAIDFRDGDVRVGLNEILVFGDISVPEPATATMGLLGLAGLLLRHRRAA